MMVMVFFLHQYIIELQENLKTSWYTFKTMFIKGSLYLYSSHSRLQGREVIVTQHLELSRQKGAKFEEEISTVVGRYTHALWRNIRIETVLTQQGCTELDLIFCANGVIYVVEAKNVESIVGEYGETYWTLVGSMDHSKYMSSPYSTLNIIVQNSLHVRALKDCFYAYYKEWPTVVPVIVVPNNCKVSVSISESIYTIGQLDLFLAHSSQVNPITSSVVRRLAALIPGDGSTIERPDFEYNESLGCRVKKR